MELAQLKTFRVVADDTHLGSTLGNLGRLREAAEAFEEALRCDPRHEKARENLEMLRRHGG